METIDQLAKASLFEGLSKDQLERLVSISVTRDFSRGATIFYEGQPGDGFYVVVSGLIKIYKVSAEGKEQILHIFGPGEPFGEVPVFEGRSFPANATCLKASRVCFFPRDSFVGLIESNPSLALAMLAVLSRRLRRFTALIDDLSLKEVPGRLASHLLYLSDTTKGADKLTLDVPKNQLASLLGTVPETLSRILTKLGEQGLIQTEARTITILDRSGLQELAEGAKRLA